MNNSSRALEEIMSIIPQPQKRYEKEEPEEDEMVGRSTNRRLNEKWNIKVQLSASFFENTFGFLRELGYNTLFRFSKEGIKIFKLDNSATHFAYVLIDKTEISEYVVDWENTPLENNKQEEEQSNEIDDEYNNEQQVEQSEQPEDIQENTQEQISDDNIPDPVIPVTPIPKEIVVYADTDIIEDIPINSKYPIDIYFDTIEKNKYYIVNGKEIVSRRLNGLEDVDNTVSMYSTYYGKMMRWMTHENTFKISVTTSGIKNVLTSLEKKKPKKETKSSAFVEVKFSRSEIDFIVQNDIKSSSIQLYGDDIVIKSKQETNAVYNLESLIKFSKLKLDEKTTGRGSNVIFYINENYPLVLETKFGAGKSVIYYIVAPRGDAT